MDNLPNNNLQNISTEDLIRELVSRGYKEPKLNNSNNKKNSSFTQSNNHVSPHIDCKQIFDSKSSQELVQFLKGYTKLQINEFYNQVTNTSIKLSGSKEDYIYTVINNKMAKERAKAFAKWV